MILNNRRIAIKEVTNDIGISFDSCQAIFTDVLGMKHTAAKIVSKLLNFEQKQRSMDIAQKMLATFNDDSDLLKTHNWWRIMGVWLWHWHQSSIIPIEEPKLIKGRQVRSNVKVLLTGFFDSNDVVHYEFLPQGFTNELKDCKLNDSAGSERHL